jgi:meso-butanediol dehydrogenase/(S,S)-butanediol dehydrogenase/diacetyl reductase
VDLDGKVALVTGAAQGIGRAIAIRLASDGADVAVNDIQSDAAEKVVTEINRTGRKGMAAVADVSDRDAVQDMAGNVVSKLGRLDIMVANAGIALVKPLLDTTPDEVLRLYRINVFGILYCIQAAAEQMKNDGRGGKIITAGAAAGHQGFGYLAAYSSTKFGIIGLTQAAAKELAPLGITVNAYCPGIVDTDMWDHVDAELVKYRGLPGKGDAFAKSLKSVPMRRAETPEDVAGAVSYLAGPGADYMTGQSVMIDGGMVMR